MSSSEPSVRRGRGRPTEFDRRNVVAAAARILERDGYEALTMRRLADEGSTTLAALYRNLGDRDGVLSATLDVYAESVRYPELPTSPSERLVALPEAMHDALLELPWIVDVLRRGGRTGAGALWFAEEFLRAAEELGCPRVRAIEHYRVVWAYVLGALLTRSSGEQMMDRDGELAATFRTADQERGFHRTLAFIDAPLGLPDAAFRRGVRILISGMVADIVRG